MCIKAQPPKDNVQQEESLAFYEAKQIELTAFVISA